MSDTCRESSRSEVFDRAAVCWEVADHHLSEVRLLIRPAIAGCHGFSWQIADENIPNNLWVSQAVV